MIKKEIVEYIAKLAKIEISSEENKFLSSQLSEIINYIDKLKEVDTREVEPMRGLYSGQPLMRKDQAKDNPAKDDILKNAPARLDDFFKVPQVLK